MSLFDFGKKKPAANKPRACIFQNTEHFRGFKRGRISSAYGPAPLNAATLANKDLTGLEIAFVENKTSDGRPMLDVYMAKKLIGNIWEDTQTYDDLINCRVEAVHIRIEDKQPKLFVKYREA